MSNLAATIIIYRILFVIYVQLTLLLNWSFVFWVRFSADNNRQIFRVRACAVNEARNMKYFEHEIRMHPNSLNRILFRSY